MSSAQGNALDWALALAKAPGERHALRQRALPEEIDALMQIAGGAASETLARAVSRTGESPEWIVEAARFYLREVLFFKEADAYRLLGVASDADAVRIRSHHRLLQQWLHPDRCSSEDAIFAARVNAAWDQIRQPDRRAAYDLSLPAQPVPTIAEEEGFASRQWIQIAVPEALEPPQERWRRRMPLLLLLLACIALGIIALRHQQLLDETGGLPLAASTGDDAPVLRLPGTDAPQVHATTPERRDPRPLAATKAAPAATPVVAALDDPFQDFPVVEDPEFVMPADGGGRPAVAAVVDDVLVPVNRSAPPTPDERKGAGAGSGKMLPPAPMDPAPGRPPATTAAAAPTTAKQSAPALVAPANVDSTVAAAALPSVVVPDRKRVTGAQQVGERLLGYLSQSGKSVPPIWDSVSAERAAAQIRTSIARGDGPRFVSPDWRISEADAALQATLRFNDGRDGRLRARLIWREQRWLVSDLSMEQDW